MGENQGGMDPAPKEEAPEDPSPWMGLRRLLILLKGDGVK